MIGKTRNLRFYWARWQQASWPELRHRAWGAVMIRRWRARFYNGKFGLENVPEMDLNTITALQVPDIAWEGDEQTRRRLLDGEIFTLNEDRMVIEHFEKKNRGVFFADIPLSRSGIDIRMVWEPARLQNITSLLWACRANQNPASSKYFQVAAQKAIIDWIEGNPCLSGPHYLSAMECGLRIPVFFLH